MRDFVLSALPWVLMGLALAILAASYGMENQQDEKQGAHIAVEAALGLLLGVTLNSCGLWESHALGCALGSLWGMALAALFRSEDVPKE